MKAITVALCFAISVISFYHLGKQEGSKKLEEQLFQDVMVKKLILALLDVCNYNFKNNCSIKATKGRDRMLYLVLENGVLK